jgi:predicted histidine transporter YuiF (NhaC family)
MEFLIAMGIPTAITGLIVWFFKRYLDKKDKEKERREAEERKTREEREKNTETLMLMIMQTSRATNVLAEATAKAVQRIPDAKCNGDMTAALETAAKIQKEEQQFLIDQGIKHIFEN